MKYLLSLVAICCLLSPVIANPTPKPKPAARKFIEKNPKVGDWNVLRLLTKFHISRPVPKAFEPKPARIVDLMMPKPAKLPKRQSASDDFPRAEFYAGFLYTSIDTESAFGSRSNGIGWNIGINGNFNRSFGMVGDFSGAYGERTLSVNVGNNTVRVPVNYSVYTLLGGPQFTSRGERISPFVRAMAGVAISSVEGEDDHAFAFAVGGGVDARLTDRISWRVLQADYVLTRFEEFDSQFNLRRGSQHSVKISTGLVFR